MSESAKAESSQFLQDIVGFSKHKLKSVKNSGKCYDASKPRVPGRARPQPPQKASQPAVQKPTSSGGHHDFLAELKARQHKKAAMRQSSSAPKPEPPASAPHSKPEPKAPVKKRVVKVPVGVPQGPPPTVAPAPPSKKPSQAPVQASPVEQAPKVPTRRVAPAPPIKQASPRRQPPKIPVPSSSPRQSNIPVEPTPIAQSISEPTPMKQTVTMERPKRSVRAPGRSAPAPKPTLPSVRRPKTRWTFASVEDLPAPPAFTNALQVYRLPKRKKQNLTETEETILKNRKKAIQKKIEMQIRRLQSLTHKVRKSSMETIDIVEQEVMELIKTEE
ncbi:hypothetical protein PCE1_001961 [Barthelona sp. PCE]